MNSTPKKVRGPCDNNVLDATRTTEGISERYFSSIHAVNQGRVIDGGRLKMKMYQYRSRKVIVGLRDTVPSVK